MGCEFFFFSRYELLLQRLPAYFWVSAQHACARECAAVILYHGQLLYVKKVHSNRNMKLFIAVVDERVIHDFVLRSFHNQRTKLHSNQI